MKRAISLFAICLVATLARGQEAPKSPTIQVSGSAEIVVVPDQVVITLDLTKRNKDLQIAKRETDAALAKIVSLTKSFNIKPEDVRTDYISVDMKYQSIRDPKSRVFDEDGEEIGTRVFLGYEVSTTLVVRLSELSRFESFFSEVLKTGVSEVDSVSFESSRLIEHRAKAREMAMKAAHDKASAMARAIDQTIGKAIYIVEVSPNLGVSSNVNTANFSGSGIVVSDSVATFSPGSIKISAQVAVTFLLY